MSSHHIVKDGQEPALIIANGEACSFELLQQLLEWNPFVVVLDEAINRVKDLGIKTDALVGDFDDHHPAMDFIKLQMPVEIIHTSDKGKTDIQKGIEFLIEKKYEAVNIVWATADKSLYSFIVQYMKQINIVMIDNHSRIYNLPKKFEKWYAKGTKLSLIPVGKVSGVKTTGLKHNLQNEELNTVIENEVAEDRVVRIEYHEGDLLMRECFD